jgi:pyruvate/2-oxoglutarate/acetoin dehydrogenase E1 component
LSARTDLNLAMRLLAAQPGAFFIGQGVAADGVATFDSLEGVPMSQRLETPVIEELQLGMGVGLAVHGNCLPVLIYPRCDFLLRAADQLVNHLDKLEEMSAGQWVPKVIIRTRVGSRTPLDPGPQHRQNHAAAFRLMLTTVCVREITDPANILPTYRRAIESERSSLVIEAF